MGYCESCVYFQYMRNRNTGERKHFGKCSNDNFRKFESVSNIDNDDFIMMETKDFVVGDKFGCVHYKDRRIDGTRENNDTLKKLAESVIAESLTDEQKETYGKWKSLVNMSSSELKSYMDSDTGKDSGLKQKEADAQGIDSGRESARAILRMKEKGVDNWTEADWKWANKQISFISRMKGNDGPLEKDGKKTRKYMSLLIWGHNPKK